MEQVQVNLYCIELEWHCHGPYDKPFKQIVKLIVVSEQNL